MLIRLLLFDIHFSLAAGNSMQQVYQMQNPPLFTGTSIMPKLQSQHATHKSINAVEKGPISDILVRSQSKSNLQAFRPTHAPMDQKPQIKIIPSFSGL